MYAEVAYETTGRMSRFLLKYWAVAKVPCPHCQAKPGWRCRLGGVWPIEKVHPLRLIAAEFIYGPPYD